jgi:phosphatidylserine/phosphatidylglycerophosphate/cardiolipin synthase-like enzyme
MEARFSSLVGGAGLRTRVLKVLRDAADLGSDNRVDVHIMTFSFTDATIARLLVDVAQRTPSVSVRLIADWSQGAEGAGRQVRALASLGLPNLAVRYKNDQPYVWDSDTGRIRWSYRASRGLLHHKTLAVLVNGQPHTLLCGSLNWTTRSANSYENVIVFTRGSQASVGVMASVEREFEAMWSDGATTLSPHEVGLHYHAILNEYRRDPQRQPTDIAGIRRGSDCPLRVLADDDHRMPAEGSLQSLIAFSSRSPHQSEATTGYAEENRVRRFDLYKPSGKTKSVPLTLSTLALDTIARAQEGERLLVAMYGLSVRVPEYGALLQAARRGVRLKIILDGHVGRPVLVALATALHEEGLPIRLRAAARTMHQKYILHPEGHAVLTGTANLSTDAVNRHSEHRILWRGDPDASDLFLADFRQMWVRLSPPFRAKKAD